MLNLGDQPLFAGLSAAGREQLQAHAKKTTLNARALLMRRGASYGQLSVIAAGRLRVYPIAGTARDLGPGEVLGEMSLLSQAAVSATVIAQEDSVLWTLPGAVFLKLVETEPSLTSRLLRVLSGRLRTSGSARPESTKPQAVLLVEPRGAPLAKRLLVPLERALLHCSMRVCTAQHASARSALSELSAWRDALTGEALILAVPEAEIGAIVGSLERQDAVLAPVHMANDAMDLPHGLADFALYREVDGNPLPPSSHWAFPIDRDELELVSMGTVPNRSVTPKLCRLARWVARKEIGIALGAGAARGFAHLGVLAELEALGLPVDRISGSSMGGIAGLLYGLGGDGPRGIELAHQTLGRPKAARLRWFPRSSILSDRELRRRAAKVAEGRSFADLPLPVSVMATDLLRGEGVVINRGLVAEGFFGTSAVPGVLPPVISGEDTLVDGGIVARIPLELLPVTRCGLRIAVNVIPPPVEPGELAEQRRALRKGIAKLFGFREVLSRSLNHIAWIHGEREAVQADVLLEPRTTGMSGVDFATHWSPMVDAGRVAVREHAQELCSAAKEMLGVNPMSTSPLSQPAQSDT